MEYKKLFDQDFINQLPTLDNFSNPRVVALCKSGKPSKEALRAKIEEWFKNLPNDQKSDMYSRLRSLDNEQHLSAFYELFFHQYCLAEGWSIQKHPSINGQSPDFFVEVPNQGSFFLEVVTLMEKEGLRKNKKQVNELLRKLDTIETNFTFVVHVRQWPAEDINYNALVREIENWLKTLRQEEKTYEIEISKFGFNVSGSIKAFYCEGDKRKSDFIYPVEDENTVVEQVKTAISDKVKKYKFTKTSDKPFVIAICNSRGILSPEVRTIKTALYGHDQIVLNKNTRKVIKVHQDYSGLVTPKPRLGGLSRNTRISAVIFFYGVLDEERMLWKYYMKVFHNPWAITKLPIGIFEKCPQLYEIGAEPEYVTLGWHNDNKQYIILNDNLLLPPTSK